MKRWFVFGLMVLALAAMCQAAPDAGRKLTARVYIPEEWWRQDQLLQLLNETDVIYVETHQYVNAVMTEDQLNRIAALGLRTEVLPPPPPQVQMNFGFFLKYAQVRDTLHAWTTRYPTICSLDSVGPFYEGTHFIYFLKVANPLTGNTKPESFFNGATHAREPMGQEVSRRFALWLLKNYGTDSTATWIVNNRQTWFAPVMNPDGYIYNETYSDYYGWRKNRNPSAQVDLNRNYGYKWGYDNNGSSGNPADETYRGPGRFSELETQAVETFFNAHRLRTGCDFHSFGHYNMCPWGYADNVPLPDSLIYWEILDTVNANNNYGTSRTGEIGKTLYTVNGSSVEWEFPDTLRDDNHQTKFVEHAITIETDAVGFWDGNTDSSIIVSEFNLNLPGERYQAKVAGAYFYRRNLYVDDTSSSNGNHSGRLDPGENANLWMTVRNHAVSVVDSAVTITAVLKSLDTAIVVTQPNASFGKILRVSTGDNRTAKFGVRCSQGAPQGSWKKFRVELTFLDDGNTIMQPLVDSLQIGNSPVAVAEIPNPDQMVRFALSPVRPNPMGHEGTVSFALTNGGEASLVVYNTLGQKVRTLVSGKVSAGIHSVVWDGRDEAGRSVAPGAYFLRYQAGGQEALGRVVVVN